jgi:hypothetical protein
VPYLPDRWFLFGVIHPHWPAPELNPDEEFEFGDVKLTRVPSWIRHRETTRRLSWEDRRLVKRSEFMLQREIPMTLHARAGLPSFYHATLALWLARPTHLTLVAAFHAGHDDDHPATHGWVPHCWQSAERLRPHPEYHKAAMTRSDLELAKRLLGGLCAEPFPPDLRSALVSLWSALTDHWVEGRYIQLWVALEALFGNSSPGETTYRLAHRLAMFLGQDGEHRDRIYRDAIQGYRLRSKVVHGHRLREDELSAHSASVWRSEELLRTALAKILTSPSLLKSFARKTREPFLDSLVFRGSPEL